MMSRRHPTGVALLLVLAMVLALGMARPLYACANQASADPAAHAIPVELADGSYVAEVALAGGTGRAGVTSPTTLVVRDGKATVTLEWSSPHYDYMVVQGERYLPTNEEGNSTFEIPVLALDEPFDVVADTTAMSQPHEIDYQITIDSDSIGRTSSTDQRPQGRLFAVGTLMLAGCAVITALALHRNNRR